MILGYGIARYDMVSFCLHVLVELEFLTCGIALGLFWYDGCILFIRDLLDLLQAGILHLDLLDCC
jgi:hypothetical protein